MTALTTVYLALRPVQPQPQLTARRTRPGCASCSALRRRATRSASSRCAATRACCGRESGKSCIAYRVVSGVMLASGDPLGDPEAWPGAIRQFVAEAERHAWTPAVIGCSQLGGEVWCRETSYDALELGDEAVVEVADFTLEGRAMRNVRQMVKRVAAGRATSTEVRRVARPDAAEMAAAIAAGPALARRRHRARLLDGAGPARRPRRPGLRAGQREQGRRAARRSCTSCRGAATACRWT